MSKALSTVAIRQALAADADGIARIYLQSAEPHAQVDPERYSVPALEAIAARYREKLQHTPEDTREITLVAEINGELVGFIDAGLDQSPDFMHKEIVYCHSEEIAVSNSHQSLGIGARLLHAAEDWGRQKGAMFASLDFHAENKRAASFYQERMGYHPAVITAIKKL